MDNRFRDFENCSIMGVWQNKLPNIKKSWRYMIEISIKKEGTVFPDYMNIKIDDSELYEKLKKLLNKEVERAYSAFGMSDIDFFYAPRYKKYCIEWSPNECSYNYFYITKKDLKMIMDAIAPDEVKKY